MSLAARVALGKVEALLARRLEELHARAQAGEAGAMSELCDVARTLAALQSATAPELTGAMLSTAEMAQRLGISSKTLLRHASEGRVKPALRRGKLVRWSGRETL